MVRILQCKEKENLETKRTNKKENQNQIKSDMVKKKKKKKKKSIKMDIIKKKGRKEFASIFLLLLVLKQETNLFNRKGKGLLKQPISNSPVF